MINELGFCVRIGVLGVALISLAGCSAGDSSTGQVTGGGSAALQGPMVFVNNTGDKTLTALALRGDSGNAVLNTLGPGVFGNLALGDMQFSQGEWIFVNLSGANTAQEAGTQVAAIDPLSGATPVHEANLQAGTRPVHIYRDTTDGEVMWAMNDGPSATGLDAVHCSEGGSVTIIHNSHLGPGAQPPTVEGTVCLFAAGHKVAAFSSGAGIPKRVFVSSTTAGEIAVIDNEPGPTKWQLINRVDLCTDAGEALNGQGPCDVNANAPNTSNTPNRSNPHGIRFSKLTGKVYSIQENYRTIVEVDPDTLGITNTIDLSGTVYTAFGITPDGRFLLLRGGSSLAPVATVLGVIDLGTAGYPMTDFTIPELDGASPGSFKFSPDGKRLYMLAGNAAAATKKDRLFAFDSSKLVPAAPATEPSLTLLPNGEIFLLATGIHSMDVFVQGGTGVGEAQFVVVSNQNANSVSIINAGDNQIKQTVSVGPSPGAVMIYSPGAAAAGNQATSSLTSGATAGAPLPERLDDHGMPD